CSPIAEVYKLKKMIDDTTGNVPKHLKDLYDRTITGMNNEQRQEVAQLLCKYSNVFSESDDDIGRTGIIKHKIPTGMNRPIKQQPRRIPVHMNKEVDEQIDKMLQEKIIQPSKSPWASCIVMVKKKDGSNRFCVDYRKLNDVTVKDSYPLPRIDESLDQLAGSKWFSCLDLNAGYWQVETDPQDREKTAFTSRKGLFEFNVMPYGLCNAPATFERLMESVLAGLHWQICLIYLDDVIVTGKTFQDMVNNLSQVFERFQQAGLKLKPRKCNIFAKQVEFLGHVISEAGIKTDPKKTDCVKKWPPPKNVHEVRAFLGLCGYYRKFVFRFSEIAKPLYKLTEKKTPFSWTDECNQAFLTLKEKLVKAPILTHPDFTKYFILHVDASDKTIGAVLSQKTETGECVIAYGSRTLSKSERRYCVTRKELLALVNFVKFFRHYLCGKQFLVRTDYGSLRWLMNFKNPEGQVARWIEFLSAFHMEIEHRPGRSHGNADGVSRIPCRQCGQNEDEDDQILCHVTQVASSENEMISGLKSAQENDRDIMDIKEWLMKEEKPTFTHLKVRAGF
ncbi:MAG: reverse transcriptase, partial [Candidatus Thiodiazotropha endolucinida]|nr:reverse transcriptase [Candidatus Thiodiazotropha taylori]MCW4343374.1 reverse transcriptase [Candidatus Thiodiazotropha endolucinida]